MRATPILSLAALLGLLPAAAAQGFSTIAYESFDYPAGTGLHGASGGIGWANAWWAGDPPNSSPIDHSITVTPGLDADGNGAEDQLGNMGTYRFPATAGFEHLLDYNTDPNGIFGKDDTTLWISFWSQRSPGSDDQYGGVSLNHQFVAEHLFLGSPNTWYEWGIHDDPWGSNSAVSTVTGSNVDQATHLVYRIDFLPGPERLRLWLDPAVAHPDTPADLDVTVHDFRFNEIGFKSGNELSQHGWLFDGIRIETPNVGVGTLYCFGDGTGTFCPCGNLAMNGGGCANGTGAGAVLTATGAPSIGADTLVLHATNLIPNQPGLYFQADNPLNGGNGIVFGDGLRCAGGNVVRIQVSVADSNGESATSLAIAAKTGVQAAETKRYQLWYRDPATSPCGIGFNLSNGLEVTWTP